MTHQPYTFVVTDPRTFDGNSYEVAGRALAQLRGLYALIELSIEPTRLMVRNAELSRQIDNDEAPDAAAWESGPQARILREISDNASETREMLRVLERAASYNPKDPPR